MYELLLAYMLVVMGLATLVTAVLEVASRLLPVRSFWLWFQLRWHFRKPVGARLWSEATASGGLFRDSVSADAVHRWLYGDPPADSAPPLAAFELRWKAIEAGMSSSYRGFTVCLGALFAWVVCHAASIDAIGLFQYLRDQPVARIDIAGLGGAPREKVEPDARLSIFLEGFEEELAPRGGSSEEGQAALDPATLAAVVGEARAIAPASAAGDDEDAYAEATLLHFLALKAALPPAFEGQGAGPAAALAAARVRVDDVLGQPPGPGPRCPLGEGHPLAEALACAGVQDPATLRWVISTLGTPLPTDLPGVARALRAPEANRAEHLDAATLDRAIAAASTQLTTLRRVDAFGLGGIPRPAGWWTQRLGEWIMAVFGALGAPFWFDLLRKVRGGD